MKKRKLFDHVNNWQLTIKKKAASVQHGT